MREKLCAHKVVHYIEDSSSQHDDTADDSNYYPSSQASQDSLLQMGIKRIESVNKVKERGKKIDTSSGVINKQEPKVEEIIAGPELMEDIFKSDGNSEELEGGIFWKEFQRKIFRCKSFADIAEIINSMKIPDIFLQRKTTMQPLDRKDRISQFLLPQDVDGNLVPVICKGDGNCLPRSISHLCFGTEHSHREIHCRMVIDAAKNISDHLNNEKLYIGAINRLPNLDIRNFYAYIVSAYDTVWPDKINEDSLLQIYQEEVKRIIELKTWMSMWHIHWVSNAVGIPIRVIYAMFNLWDRNYFNQFVYPLDKKNYSSDLTIMWTSTNDVELTIGHFVPLMLRK